MAEELTTAFEKTSLNTVKRYKHRAIYTKAQIYSIFNAASVLHVAFVDDQGLPQCIPMVGALEEKEDGETFVYLHGSSIARFIKVNEGGSPIVITATIVDGFILSLTPYSHDVQYRTSILHGSVYPFEESYDGDVEAAKLEALTLITNAVCKGRWEQTRVPPTKTEMTATSVLRVRVESASAKVNAGGVDDKDFDTTNKEVTSRVWTGVLPIKTIALPPIPATTNLIAKIPDHVANFVGDWETGMNEAGK